MNAKCRGGWTLQGVLSHQDAFLEAAAHQARCGRQIEVHAYGKKWILRELAHKTKKCSGA